MVAAKNETVLGIDIGGTSIKSAVVDVNSGRLMSERVIRPTPVPSHPKAVFETIDEILKVLDWHGAIGCGFPAVVENGVTMTAANVDEDWIGFDALTALEAINPEPGAIINDADAAGLAEMAFGIGQPYNHADGGVVLMITLGTGIGSAIFVNGQLHRNTELGHIELDGIAAEDRAATIVREKEQLTWEVWGKRVNRYLQMLEKLLWPDVIIIGGGVSAACDQFFPYLDLHAKVRAAEMRNDAGIVGAALGLKICGR